MDSSGQSLPMFPLGSVLFPHMPLALRVFEPRYLQLMVDLLDAEVREFGVVLIERGFEVGGGDHRFGFGTVARLIEVSGPDDNAEDPLDQMVAVVAVGGARIEIERWLPDEPYPRAEVRRVDELIWSEEDRPRFDQTAKTVRRCLANASEYADLSYAADIELSDDPVAASWQLAGILPAGPLDQVGLLRSGSTAELLRATAEQAEADLEMLRLSAASD